MATRNTEVDPEIEKILEKTFHDLQKRLTTLLTRREKKVAKAAIASVKTGRDRVPERTDRDTRTDRGNRGDPAPERGTRRRPEKEHERSRSTSEDSS